MTRSLCGILVAGLVLCGCDDGPEAPERPPVWGEATDVPVPADYDGDGAADIAVYRAAGAEWYLRVDCDDDCDFDPIVVGLPADLPVQGVYDVGGRTRPATFESHSEAMWHVAAADCAVGSNCPQRHVQWGQTGDIPVPADYDGDDIDEIAIVRPAEGTWYFSYDNCPWDSGCTEGIVYFGGVGDRPAPADYDGDGKAEMAFWRPTTEEWHICPAAGCPLPVVIEVQGAADVLVPADYDGDGDDDIAFYTSSDQTWHIAEDTCTPADCPMRVVQFGTSSADIPVPADYDGDGMDDIAVASPGPDGLTWLVQ